jgi:diguanylate cyclase (GGDEF)-like protein
LCSEVVTGVDLWNQKTVQSLILPGGLLLLAAMVIFRGAFGPIPTAAIDFYYYAVFAAGMLLAWRFHSSRILFALVTLFLASRALEFFAAGRITSTGPGRIALEAVALLLPLNFIALSILPERGWAFSPTVSRLAVVFFESVFVAVICRPGSRIGPAILHPEFLGHFSRMHLPTLAGFALLIAVAVMLARSLLYHKPTEGGLLWALVATFMSFQAGAVGPTARAYVATAALALASSVIENSYFLAYHDELTMLPGRRAFNDALFRLEEPYAVAVVDIDHFKKFNDTYGHETGDQVLRMVAAKLARVTGGGQAYRVGGEEFTVLFSGKSAKDVQPHLELLRTVIEASEFRKRVGEERRRAASQQNLANPESYRPGREQPARDLTGRDRVGRDQAGKDKTGKENPGKEKDRRSVERRMQTRPPASRKKSRIVIEEAGNRDLSVTVSIGIAEPTPRLRTVDSVIQAADKALYRAKQSGRNRIELASSPRLTKPKRSIA